MRLVVALLLLLPHSSAAGDPAAVNLTGRWNFSVDMLSGGHGRPVILLHQDGIKLTGRYRGPLGVFELSGRVEQAGWLRPSSVGSDAPLKFAFFFEYSSKGKPVRAVYEGVAKPDGTLSGAVEFSGAVKNHGYWTATRDVLIRPSPSAKGQSAAR